MVENIWSERLPATRIRYTPKLNGLDEIELDFLLWMKGIMGLHVYRMQADTHLQNIGKLCITCSKYWLHYSAARTKDAVHY